MESIEKRRTELNFITYSEQFRLNPMEIAWTGCPATEVVRGRMNGRPVVKNSRVLADTIAECAELGETAEEIASDYRLSLGRVKEILADAAAQSEAAPAY
jgi:uncharacterized protein (DUF433 family)